MEQSGDDIMNGDKHMNVMQIFEPAMCCSTGLCGVGVDSELLRISTVIKTLEKNGIVVARFNLSDAPQEFVKNKVVNDFLIERNMDGLPVTILDGTIKISGRYPTNEEFAEIFEIPVSILGEQSANKQEPAKDTCQCGCSCGEGCC